MTYVLPEDSTPGYLLFWSPEDDAVLFDLMEDTNLDIQKSPKSNP